MKPHILATGLATALMSALPTLAPTPATAAEATCTRPVSNAEALQLTTYYAGWLSPTVNGDTRVSVYIKRHPAATADRLATIRQAISIWNNVLSRCLDGAVQFTTATSSQSADLVLHYVPRWGGNVYGGVAACLPNKCQVRVRSEFANKSVYSQTTFLDIVLHELGHILGLGHATNIAESHDLMGYGWGDGERGVLSQCDVDALAYVWSWAIEGGEAAPATGTYDCETGEVS